MAVQDQLFEVVEVRQVQTFALESQLQVPPGALHWVWPNPAGTVLSVTLRLTGLSPVALPASVVVLRLLTLSPANAVIAGVPLVTVPIFSASGSSSSSPYAAGIRVTVVVGADSGVAPVSAAGTLPVSSGSLVVLGSLV